MQKQLTAEEVLEILKKEGISATELYEGYDNEKLGSPEIVDEWRGGGGNHDTYFAVIKFQNCSDCFRIDGYYSSWDGVDFSNSNDIVVVEKREVTVTRWMAKS